jgi:hypothetical protein
MASKAKQWKTGRGTLGVFEPLIGAWEASTDSPMGPLRCTRAFSRILAGTAVQLEAGWHLPDGKVYRELAIYRAEGKGAIAFWSFTSDGKRSEGARVAAPDLHPEALAFEAQMPAGLARMAYWPGENGVMEWAVESKTKQGWNRFTHHRYVRV